jgi:hypothetical protein
MRRLWLTAVLGTLALAAFHGCKKQSALEGTALLVNTTLSGVPADQLRFTGFDTADDGGVFGPALRPDPPGTVPSTSTERVLLKDSLATHTIDVWVEAMHQGSPVGAGHNTVTVVLGMETKVDVAIEAMIADAGCDGCRTSTGFCETSISLSACGKNGEQCSDCTGHADSCTDGVCKCGSNAECLASGADSCVGGQCKSSCAGCIVVSSGACVTASVNECGAPGAACVACNAAAMTSDTCGADGMCHCGQGPQCTPIVGGNFCNNGVCQCGTQPSCGQGTECRNGSCVCTPDSCPNGCCVGTSCVTGDSANACGRGGGACLDCGGTACDGGVCAMALCNASNCASGCCSGASCFGGNSGASCGIGGNACTQCGLNEICDGGTCVSSCNASSCDGGCCDRNGACQPGNDPSMCGIGGVGCNNCGTNACTLGVCTGGGCGPANCVGCCDGGTCITAIDSSACGLGGNACLDCGTNPCANGACVTCSAANCDGGCCSGGVCQPGTVVNACGTGGATCQSCGGGNSCDAGVCVVACNANSCGMGCCDSTGMCQQRSLATCGSSGSACMACDPKVANGCAAQGCRCGTQSQCAPGNICNSDGGCACDPTTCMGCCGNNGLCQPGTAKNACGVMGNACVNCMGNMKCDGGSCS